MGQGQTVAKFNAVFGMTNSGYIDAIHEVQTVTYNVNNNIVKNTQQAARATGAANRSMTGSMGQLAYGLEDFMSQVSTMGYAGGLRAASNNISAFGASFGPIGLAIGVVASMGMNIIPVFFKKAGDEAKHSKDKLAEYNDEMERHNKLIGLRNEMAGKAGKGEADDLKKDAEKHKNDLKSVQDQIAFRKQEMARRDSAGNSPDAIARKIAEDQQRRLQKWQAQAVNGNTYSSVNYEGMDAFGNFAFKPRAKTKEETEQIEIYQAAQANLNSLYKEERDIKQKLAITNRQFDKGREVAQKTGDDLVKKERELFMQFKQQGGQNNQGTPNEKTLERITERVELAKAAEAKVRALLTGKSGENLSDKQKEALTATANAYDAVAKGEQASLARTKELINNHERLVELRDRYGKAMTAQDEASFLKTGRVPVAVDARNDQQKLFDKIREGAITDPLKRIKDQRQEFIKDFDKQQARLGGAGGGVSRDQFMAQLDVWFTQQRKQMQTRDMNPELGAEAGSQGAYEHMLKSGRDNMKTVQDQLLAEAKATTVVLKDIARSQKVNRPKVAKWSGAGI